MKKTILIIGTVIFASVFIACNSNEESSAKDDTNTKETTELTEAEFMVSGNCGMCEERIETAALNVSGVETADWNKESKMMKLSFSSEVNVHDIHQAIADAGHDTEMHKAKDEVYKELPACCLYRDGDGGHTH